ncbi:hypothetical protein Z945_3776 [Sulfitobacter noctilucae]|uniref:hypothetical protein n=1 Tax=Sulfitobacter noctilucae TaxID=1342302 RepID=UPI00046A43B5|nr:hypothetical protein [Sulfitobacter noctilucae]KIN69884.1 hypothetical protein Z945_3776 [Sulfitobacter noctilucae]
MPDRTSRKHSVPNARRQDQAGAREGIRKIEGKAVARILDAKTRAVVGHLYEWNTGQIEPKWKDDIEREDVIYDYA